MGGRELTYKDLRKLNAGSSASLTDIIPALIGSEVQRLTLTQIATLIAANLGTAVADDLTLSSITISSLTAALSAGTFSTTGQTSGAMGAVASSSSSNIYGLATKGQMEFLLTTVLNNKTAIDEIRS